MPERSAAMPSVSPYLTVSDARAAVEFYKQAFGAEETFRMDAEDGRRLMHCALLLNGSLLMLSDHFPEFGGGCLTPELLGGTPVTIHLAVVDADAVWERALTAGASVVVPLADMFWGDRFGKLRDPYGHIWSIAAPLQPAGAAAPSRAAKRKRAAKAKTKARAKLGAKQRAKAKAAKAKARSKTPRRA